MKGIFLNIIQALGVLLFLMSSGNSTPTKSQKGKASYYGKEFEGRKTACGEIFHNADFTAAHRKLPFHTFARVTNLKNDLTITVRINDRGPFVKSRIIDLSEAGARRIGSYNKGLASVKVEELKLLHKNPEIDSLFTCEDVTDCLGNPDQLEGYSLSLWRTNDIIHMLYIANELYLHEDVKKVLIVGLGVGAKRVYHLTLTGYPNKESAAKAYDFFERKGFMEVRLLKTR
jgi:rare lipoprotein A